MLQYESLLSIYHKCPPCSAAPGREPCVKEAQGSGSDGQEVGSEGGVARVPAVTSCGISEASRW